MADAPYLSVIGPCWNMGPYIEKVLRSYVPVLEGIGKPFEFIPVPNNCTDDTPAICHRLAAEDPRFRVVENPPGGWGRSVRAGMAAARGELICYTNLARVKPEVVAAVHDLYVAHAPCIAKMQRVARGQPHRQIGSFFYNLGGRLLLGIRTPDVNGTPKIFHRSLLEQVRLRETHDLMDMEFIAQTTQLGVPIFEYPVPGFGRHGGKTTTTIKSAVKMYWGTLRVWWNHPKPGAVT